MNKLDALNEMKRQIGYSEMEQVLSYYNIRVVRKKMLCPFPGHNDRHLGNCTLTDRGYVYCFACGRKASAIDMVMMNENLEFVPALEFLWTTILGRTLPEYDKPEKRKYPVLSVKDLSFIGLNSPSIKYVRFYINLSEDKDEDLPKDCYMDRDGLDNFGIYKKERSNSFFDLIENDPKTAKGIATAKCKDTEKYYLGILKDLDDVSTEYGKTAAFDAGFKKDSKEYCLSQIEKCKFIMKKINKIHY